MGKVLVTPAGSVVSLRPIRPSDRDELVRHANDRAVWRNMTHAFPHPYTGDDFDEFFALVAAADPLTDFAIVADDQLVGVIGAAIGSGIYEGTARIGYWLGQPAWGKGIATEATRQMVTWLLSTLDLRRIGSSVFAWNSASMRVLEKNGFVVEGRLVDAVSKDGEVCDKVLYGMVVTGPHEGTTGRVAPDSVSATTGLIGDRRGSRPC